MAVAAVAELPSVASITTKLQALLERAKAVKPSASVDPALPTTELVPLIDSLDADVDGQYASDQAYRFAAVETAAREQFYTTVGCPSALR
jgi:THO complex subunit 1